MALKIYSEADPSADYSIDGAFTDPLLIVMDGKYGGVLQKKLYIRNGNTLAWYSDISLQIVDLTDITNIDGTKGFTWKLIEGTTQPSDDQWDAITTGNAITFDDLGTLGSSDTSTYLPFWLRVEIPRNIEVQTILDVQLKIITTEHAV